MRVVVSDDGRGFLPVNPVGPGLGLPWTRERVRCFGGSIEIESAPGSGARVAIDLPVTIPAELMIEEPHGQPVTR
jgi:signal transduction histidine kinase